MSKWVDETIKNLTAKVIDNRGKTPPLADNGIDLLEVNTISGP